jgi:tetratricopeptide (TPR) repeat protein
VQGLIDARKPQAALARVDAALARSPGHPRLLELRGSALAASGRSDEARAAYERVLQIESDSARAIAGLASLHAAAGRTEEAIALYDRAYALDPNEGDYAYSSAQLVLANGDEEAATERLRHIISFHPGVVGARNDLAWILAESGDDLDLALKLVSDARRKDASPAVLDTAGWVHFRREEYDEAALMLEVAAAVAPNDPSIRYRFARALEKVGQRDRARTMLEQAISLGGFPEIEDARRQLAELSDLEES